MTPATTNRTFLGGRHALAALAVVAASWAAAPHAAAAQVAETWVHATPIEAMGDRQSARLTAMGGLTVASEDRFSRLNAYEYGSNPAGLLGLRDTSWAEHGSEYQSFDDGYYAEDHSAIMRKSGSAARCSRSAGRWGSTSCTEP